MAEDNLDPSKQQPPRAKPVENAKSSASPIQPLTAPASSPSEKSSTSRINLTSAVPPVGGMPSTARVTSESPKKATSRVNIPTGQVSQMPVFDKNEAIKKSTVRVQIEDIKKGDTQQIKAQQAAGDAAKQKTSQINLNEVLGDDQDIFKRRTTMLDASKFVASAGPASNVPRTIRIKQPDPSATSSIRKPTEEIPQQMAPVPPASLEGSKKSETARIELPPGVEAAEEIPPTRRKTIRIKRPEGIGGPGSRPVVITQTTEVGALPVEDSAGVEADEPGTVFVALAAVASLAVIGLITVQILALNSLGSY